MDGHLHHVLRIFFEVGSARRDASHYHCRMFSSQRDIIIAIGDVATSLLANKCWIHKNNHKTFCNYALCVFYIQRITCEKSHRIYRPAYFYNFSFHKFKSLLQANKYEHYIKMSLA